MGEEVSKFFYLTSNYLHKDFGVSARMKFVRELLPELNGKSILDLGCGDGRISLQFQQTNQITLVDQSETMLELAKRNIIYPNLVNVVQSDIDHFNPEQRFDFVLCLGLLSHVSNWKAAIQRVSRLVELNGFCVFQISDGERWLTRQLTAPRGNRKHVLNVIGWREMENECQLNGLRFEKMRRYGFLLPGMGRMPNRLLYEYTLLTARFRFFAGLNTEVICVFQKSGIRN